MTQNPTLTLLVSIISGGLAGGIVSAISNRIFHWRALRTAFYPKLNNMYAAYMIRLNEIKGGRGRQLVNIPGQMPSNENAEFVEHRSDFIQDLITFNELKEARKLRQAILDNSVKAKSDPILSKIDLQPEATALDETMKILHKKLKLDQR